MKMIFGFFSGLVISGLLFVGMQTAIPIRAQSETLSAESDNLSQSLVSLLPDIQKIYREALTFPLQEAEKEIYDEDVAQFYHRLLERSGLNISDGEAN